MAQFEAFESELRSLVGRLAGGSTLVLFGHVGEGNLHVNILCPSALHAQVTAAVLDLVSAHRGSISAEHGVGILKAEWIGLTRSSQEMALLKSIKSAIDPRDLLNPGVIFSRGPRVAVES